MMRIRLTMLAASLVGVLALAGAANAVITGTYQLTVVTTMTAPNCTWAGQGGFTQNGTNLSGTAFLQLDMNNNPDPFCVAAFPTLSGPLSGTLIGNAITLTGTLGPFTAHFVGTTGDHGLTGTGTWTASVGRLRVRGNFEADRVFAPAPALGGPALGLLVLTLFGIGASCMRRPAPRGC